MAALWADKSKLIKFNLKEYVVWWVAFSVPAGSSFSLIGAAGRTTLPVEPGGTLQGVSPLVCFLGGGIIVAPWFGRRVDVEGGYACLHISSAGPR